MNRGDILGLLDWIYDHYKHFNEFPLEYAINIDEENEKVFNLEEVIQAILNLN